MNAFIKFILFVFIILIALTPILAPIIFNFLSFIIILYLIPSEIYFTKLSSIIVLSFTLYIFNMIMNIILYILGFSSKAIDEMLKENKIVGFFLKGTSHLTALLIGYTILESKGCTSLVLYKNGLIFLAIFSSLLNLLFTYLYIIIIDKHRD